MWSSTKNVGRTIGSLIWYKPFKHTPTVCEIYKRFMWERIKSHAHKPAESSLNFWHSLLWISLWVIHGSDVIRLKESSPSRSPVVSTSCKWREWNIQCWYKGIFQTMVPSVQFGYQLVMGIGSIRVVRGAEAARRLNSWVLRCISILDFLGQIVTHLLCATATSNHPGRRLPIPKRDHT